MRGTPIWQLVCVVLMFAAAGVPVLRLTAPASASAAIATPMPTAPAIVGTATLAVQVGFAPAPADFALRTPGEKTVLSGQGPTADFTGQWTVALPPEGTDLTLQAHWPEATGGHVAAHVTVRFPDGHEITGTFWRDAAPSMVETLTVKP